MSYNLCKFVLKKPFWLQISMLQMSWLCFLFCVVIFLDSNENYLMIFKGVSMIRVDFGPISETVYIDIILNTIIER